MLIGNTRAIGVESYGHLASSQQLSQSVWTDKASWILDDSSSDLPY
jgi:hypothetical protein